MSNRLPEKIRRIFAEWGATGGKIAASRMNQVQRNLRARKASAAARAKRMALPAAERSAMARRAVQARWEAAQAAKRKGK